MANQAGPIDELVQYKKDILSDNRRDSKIRGSIEATLKYFSNRRSEFLESFDSRTASLDFEDRKDSSIYQKEMEINSSASSSVKDLPKYNYNGPSQDLVARSMPKEMSKEKKEINVSVYDLDLEKHLDGHDDHHPPTNDKLSIRMRLKHFTFAWYAWTMATGGVAFTLSVIPFRFTGLTGLGTGIFIFNLFFFVFVTTGITARFILHPGTLTNALTNPHEGFFFATAFLTMATMITNTTAYGIPNSGPWLIDALRIAFWIYTLVSSFLAVFYYYVLFTVKALEINKVLPGWVLPIFPAMLVGTLASAIAKTQPAEHAFPMLVAGLSYQGLGMMFAVMIYAIYFGRLMTSGLPVDKSRPAMFIAVGPPSFTALALIGMAQDVVVTKIFPDVIKLPGIQNPAMITDFLQLLALLSAIGLWIFAAWCFFISLVAMFEAIHRNDFHLNWYAKIFPNVGFTIATIKIGERLDSNTILIVGTGMASVLFFGWVIVMVCHVKAFAQHKIAWPGKDEDSH